MAFWKESMINRLPNLINRNRSAAKISQVLCSNMNTYLHEYGIWKGWWTNRGTFVLAMLSLERGSMRQEWLMWNQIIMITNKSFISCIYFAGRGMVDGSNKRWDGRKKIVLDCLFSLSFCIHLLSFQVRPFSVHFAYQSVPFRRLLSPVCGIASYVLVVFFESPGSGVHVKFC